MPQSQPGSPHQMVADLAALLVQSFSRSCAFRSPKFTSLTIFNYRCRNIEVDRFIPRLSSLLSLVEEIFELRLRYVVLETVEYPKVDWRLSSFWTPVCQRQPINYKPQNISLVGRNTIVLNFLYTTGTLPPHRKSAWFHLHWVLACIVYTTDIYTYYTVAFFCDVPISWVRQGYPWKFENSKTSKKNTGKFKNSNVYWCFVF